MAAANDDIEMEKIAEDELSKLQRQFRIMEIDRVHVTSSAQPTLRMQRNIIRILHQDLDKIMLELKLTKSTSNLIENSRSKDQLITLLKNYEIYSSEVKQQKANISELNFLLRQVQREIKGLQSRGSRSNEDYNRAIANQSLVKQLENRLDTAIKKFNTANAENLHLRMEIDVLLKDRQSFNTVWRTQLKRLMEGKAQILELVEQAITTYDQREEWCSKLDALKEKAAVDYRKHCLEIRELQRQLDHSLKLEDFLRTKGTVRLTAADAKAEAKKIEQQEEEMKTYNNYVDVLDAIKEFIGEDDVDKLIQDFTRREEENFALFNYINEVNTELKNLNDNVKTLRNRIDDEIIKQSSKEEAEEETVESLQIIFEEKRKENAKKQMELSNNSLELNEFLQQIYGLAMKTECDNMPMMKLLGKSVAVNINNVKLYIKSLEKKIVEVVDIIKTEEALQRKLEMKGTPPSTRRRSHRNTPRPLIVAK